MCRGILFFISIDGYLKGAFKSAVNYFNLFAALLFSKCSSKRWISTSSEPDVYLQGSSFPCLRGNLTVVLKHINSAVAG